MKITSSRQELLHALGAVQGIAQASLSNPIVENVLIQAEKNTVAFTATNMSLSIQAKCEGKVDDPGEVTLPAKYSFNIMKEMPEGEIEITLEKNKIKIKGGTADVNLNYQPADQFPGIFFDLDGTVIKLPVTDFKQIVRKTLFATTPEKSRFELDGVKMDITEKEIKWISTDGKRLSQITTPAEGIVKGDEVSSILIPAKTLSELARILPTEGEISVAIGENKVAFAVGEIKVLSSLLVDNFPPYTQIIPSDYRQRVAVERQNFTHAVSRASILSNEKTNLVKLNFASETLSISGERQEIGEAKSSIPVEYKDEEFETGYKSDYLIDVLRVIDTDKITMEWMHSTSPLVIRPFEEETFLHVIMPMKLSEK